MSGRSRLYTASEHDDSSSRTKTNLGLNVLIVSTSQKLVRQIEVDQINSGDSWTVTGFDLDGTLPSLGNQLGNPEYPGITTSGGRNWIGDILADNRQLLSHNFASNGATIDSSIIAPEVTGALSLVDQIKIFTSNLVPPPNFAPWNQQNALFDIWMSNTDLIISPNQSDWTTICQQLIDSTLIKSNLFIMWELEVLYSWSFHQSSPPCNAVAKCCWPTSNGRCHRTVQWFVEHGNEYLGSYETWRTISEFYLQRDIMYCSNQRLCIATTRFSRQIFEIEFIAWLSSA